MELEVSQLCQASAEAEGKQRKAVKVQNWQELEAISGEVEIVHWTT